MKKYTMAIPTANTEENILFDTMKIYNTMTNDLKANEEMKVIREAENEETNKQRNTALFCQWRRKRSWNDEGRNSGSKKCDRNSISLNRSSMTEEM